VTYSAGIALPAPIAENLRQIIAHLIDIGAGYLSLIRPVSTLSGGESQRVKMACQLDCALPRHHLIYNPGPDLSWRAIEALPCKVKRL
jgi:excinuclease UvrABC ATPase subunit